jgi:NADH-quinone oxidoreductase subunit I
MTGYDDAVAALQAAQGPVPDRSRGMIALAEPACTSCMLCARECPDWCIEIDSHKDTVEPEGGGRPRVVHVLDRFAIDFGLCMWCGICIEVCPFDALFWAPSLGPVATSLVDLLQERAELAQWLPAVPDRGGTPQTGAALHE